MGVKEEEPEFDARMIQYSGHTVQNTHLCTSALFALLLLSACGGGNVDNSQEPAAGNASADNAAALASRSWSTFGPFDDWAGQATERYAGATDQVVLDQATTGLFLGAVMQGDFPVEPGGKAASVLDVSNVLDNVTLFSTSYFGWDATNLPSPGIKKCEDGGAMHVDIASTSQAGEYQTVVLVDYDQCTQNERKIDGALAMAWQGGLTDQQDLALAFDHVELTLYSRRISVSGVQRQSFQCEDQFRINTTLLLGELDSNRQMLFENLTRKSSRSSLLECDYHDVVLWDKINGTVFDSGLGSVIVSTAEPLRFTHDPFSLSVDQTRFDAIKTEEGYGLVELRGSENSLATFTFKPTGLTYSQEFAELPVATLSISHSSANEPAVYLSPTLEYEIGSLADLADDDADGLPNSWERTNGLDPADASDATSDTDLDGWNALQEYAALGNPAESSYENVTIDQSIRVELANEVDVETGATSVKVQVTGSRAANDPDPQNRSYLLTLGGGAIWDTSRLPDTCIPVENTSNLACSYEYQGSRWVAGSFVAEPLFVLSTKDTVISVNASYSGSVLDRSTDNNHDAASIDYQREAHSDFRIAVDGWAIGNADDKHSLRAAITQPEKSKIVDLDVHVAVPDSIVITAAEFRSTGSQALISRCTIAAGVSCLMNEVRHTDELSLEIEYYLQGETDQEILWTLNTPANDVNSDNDSAITRVSYLQSVAALQTLIDSAVSGDEVVLPAGGYTGTLDLMGKSISVSGSTSTELTRLVSADPDSPLIINAGPRSSISHLELRTTGAPVLAQHDENVTLSDSLIAPIDGVPHNLTRLVDARSSSSYRLLNNRIVGWGQGEGNRCESLISYDGGGSSYITAVFLDRNLFLNNACDQVLLVDFGSGRYYPNVATHYVNNNTFVGNASLFRFLGQSGRAVAHFKNNIIADADMLLEIDDGLYRVPYGSPFLISSRNLVWNSERESLLSNELIARDNIAIEQMDIAVDPLFIDSGAANYQLSVGSAAIDAGVEPTPYYWTYSNYINENLAPAADEQLKSVDGLQDGEAEFDLGAFEYQPAL